MHVGHTAIFQNPNQAVTDYQIYQEDMALAKECADLGFQSVWGIEHHFTDYIRNPNITQFLSYMAGYNPKIKVGSMVVVMPWYPAIRIAENMAMLDAIPMAEHCSVLDAAYHALSSQACNSIWANRLSA